MEDNGRQIIQLKGEVATLRITIKELKAQNHAMGDWVITQDDELICRELRHWNKDLILAAVNGCKSVNPTHPELVAQQIEKAFEVLVEFTYAKRRGFEYELHKAYDHAEAVLSAISNEQETL